jgi:hypothetical protein
MRLKELTVGALTLLATAAFLADCQGIPIDPIRGLTGSAGANGSSGTGGSTGSVSVEGCDMAAELFASHTCNTICHSAAGAPVFGGFDMTAAAGFPKNLVGGMPPTPAAANMNKCGGMTPPLVYLKPGVQPAQGLFLDKLKPNPPCGVQMPMGLAPLSASDLDCIQRWANKLVADVSGVSTVSGGSSGSGGASGTGGSPSVDASVDSSDAALTPEGKCFATRGKVISNLCCNSAGDFPDQCLVGACSCAPADSHQVSICLCQPGTCYLPGRGCVGSDCTIGADQTCNDNPIVSSYQGHCVAGAGGTRCVCNQPFTLNPNNGRCG